MSARVRLCVCVCVYERVFIGSHASIQLPSISGPINETVRVGGRGGQVSKKAQKGNKEGTGSDP